MSGHSRVPYGVADKIKKNLISDLIFMWKKGKCPTRTDSRAVHSSWGGLYQYACWFDEYEVSQWLMNIVLHQEELKNSYLSNVHTFASKLLEHKSMLDDVNITNVLTHYKLSDNMREFKFSYSHEESEYTHVEIEKLIADILDLRKKKRQIKLNDLQKSLNKIVSKFQLEAMWNEKNNKPMIQVNDEEWPGDTRLFDDIVQVNQYYVNNHECLMEALKNSPEIQTRKHKLEEDVLRFDAECERHSRNLSYNPGVVWDSKEKNYFIRIQNSTTNYDSIVDMLTSKLSDNVT